MQAPVCQQVVAGASARGRQQQGKETAEMIAIPLGFQTLMKENDSFQMKKIPG